MKWWTRKRICPNKRLHEIAEDDKDRIHNTVKIYGVNCKAVIKEDGRPSYIDFICFVYNFALVQVSVDDTVKGSILFWKDGFKGEYHKMRHEPTIVNNKAKNCYFRGNYSFTIRQDLIPSEVAYISSAAPESCFQLSELTVTMSGDGFSDKRLPIGFNIKPNDVLLADPPTYIFGGDGERDAILKDLNQFLDEGRVLRTRAEDPSIDYTSDEVAKWERKVSDHLSVNINRHQRDSFMKDTDWLTYVPKRQPNGKRPKQRFLNRIHTRVERLEALIKKLMLGSPIIRD